ncbi:hypothetical protein OG976_06320 [Mycobacterium sp. NBC_00419]|uniref:hypothetical protein n=1 Tax=Mycobacterium sp. NBC_00419 TaxID=2975989 RepID=UPI002E1C56A7
MDISLRSQLTAGVTLLAATAIAITPITQPSLLSSADRAATQSVALAALASPLNAVAEVIEDVNTNIFYNGAWDAPWNTLPTLSNYAYAGYQGILPDFAFWPLPLAQTVVTNLSGYVWAGIRGVGDFANKSLQAVWNTPFALVDAAQLLIAGDPNAALAVIQSQIILPLQKGINSALNSANYIVSNLVENAGIVASALPTLVTNLVGVTVGGASYIVNQAIATLTTAFGQLTSGQFGAAWDTAVNGFLGRNGTLGYLEQLTIGPGVVTTDPSNPVIPSLRAVVTQGTRQLADSFYNPTYNPATGPFQPAAAAKSAAPSAVSALRAAAQAGTESADTTAVTEVAKPEAGPTPGDTGTAGAGSPDTGSAQGGAKSTGGSKRAHHAPAGKSAA